MLNVKTKFSLISFLFIATNLVACAPEKKASSDEDDAVTQVVSGDLLISGSGSRDVKVFSSTGIYKGTLLDLDNTSGQAPYGMAYNSLTNEILVAVDSTTSRLIKAVSLTDFSVRDFSASPALNAALRAIAMLTTGDLLVSVSGGNRVEKLSGLTGTQITAGSWPKALQTTGSGIDARASGTFVHCSTGTDVVRLYDATGTQTATASSGIAGTTDVMDCKADAAGNIYAVFNGTTDTVRKYSSNLGTTTWSYSNTVLLPSPSGMAVESDGSVLVLDNTYNYVLKISADGSSATVLGNDSDNMLATPQFIMIMP